MREIGDNAKEYGQRDERADNGVRPERKWGDKVRTDPGV